MPYSAIGLQELNLAYHFPQIYWNTACLTINAGADEQSDNNKTTQYGKVATAISDMQKRGANVSLPLINEAEFSFVPDEENDRIIYSLRGIYGIGDDLAKTLVELRPYTSMEDFYKKVVETKLVEPAGMIKLIKAGCFVELHNEDTRVTMEDYIKKYLLKPCSKLTFSQFAKMQEMNMIPESLLELSRIQNFKKYVLSEEREFDLFIDPNAKRGVPKCGYNDRHFVLNSMSMPYYQEHFTEESVVGVKGEYYVVSEKAFEKEVTKKVQPLVDWFGKEETLEEYNNNLFNELWTKHASGTVSKWEMESLSFYYSEHELIDLNNALYGVRDYFELPEVPESYDYYVRYVKGERREVPKFSICRLAGTILDTDKNKNTVTLLTTTGVVSVKFNKGQFLHYNKEISARLDANSDKKTILERSWLKRGNKVLICGYRDDQIFRAYRYSDTVYNHTLSLITEIKDDGTVTVINERARVEDYLE